VWCLGDVVGYGPRPNECCALVREHAAFALCGNHDLAVVGGIDLSDFSGDAAVAARWTRDVLDPGHAEWLRSLAASGTRSGIEAYHGSPRDAIWDYVLSDEIALASLALTTSPLVLVGHSHVALAVWLDGDHLDGGQAGDVTEVAWSAHRSLLNPGSVGQPRDSDPRAAWAVLDLDAKTAAFRRTAYDVDAAQRDSRAAGLPEILAERLAHGI
jgi:diadenosine tetraphosphatase ApaH/serine/threonine PP2A family protein phosphatase